MLLFDALGHYFTHLFPHNGPEVKALLADISPFVNLAGPIVQDIEQELKPLLTPDQLERATALNKFLAKYVTKEQELEAAVNALIGLPIDELLREAAKTILVPLLPASVPASLVNLVIETAYQLFVVRKAPATPAVPPATPVPVHA